MDNQILQCLNQSKILLMNAEKGDWEQFEALHPIWTNQVESCLAEQLANPDKMFALSIQSIIDDVDQIQELIKLQMVKVEEHFADNRRLHKAVQTYLK